MNRTFASRSALTTLFAVAACLPLRAQGPTGPNIFPKSNTHGTTVHQSSGTVNVGAVISDTTGLTSAVITGANRTLVNTFTGTTSADISLSWKVSNYPTGSYSFTYYAKNASGASTTKTFTLNLVP